MRYSEIIKKQILNIKEGKLFVPRDFETIAPRYSIDRKLSNLAKAGAIIRVTRGIFMRSKDGSHKPSVEEVAEAKARAFARSIKFLNAKFSGEHGVYTFLCTGSSTSFQYDDHIINFKGTSPRNFRKAIFEKNPTRKEQSAATFLTPIGLV